MSTLPDNAALMRRGMRQAAMAPFMVADGDWVMPRDRALQWMELTDTERRRLFVAASLPEGA